MLRALAGWLLLAAALCSCALGAGGDYGRLIAQGRLESGVPKASFHGAHPAHVYWLVVTNPMATTTGTGGTLPSITWSVSCSNPARRASGGATGEATIARGRWVKRVRADWIKHPSYCSGKVEGLAASAPLKIRIYAD